MSILSSLLKPLSPLPGAMYAMADRLSAQLRHLGVEPAGPDRSAGLLTGVDPSSLLDRPPHPLDERAIEEALRGRRVLITGAGGSIGSQIARIVARFSPELLVLMDRSENGLFEVDRQLRARFPRVRRRIVLADVTDTGRTMELALGVKPHVIYHAAAHKHVPMMEDHPREAVVNNYFGTRSIADAAAASGAQRFVMISTDKAVNPTSVMGATKRLAELYVQHLAGEGTEGPRDPGTQRPLRGPSVPRSLGPSFCMVRFGNVLGSACSVVPIWTQQLAEGGPITVTDPRMTRYFMTIAEAAALVIQASVLAEQDNGQVFVLDMGEPVRILDLAYRFVTLATGDPRGAPIVFTGVRPGEKLHEELAYDHEDAQPTAHRSVRRLRTSPPDPAMIRAVDEELEQLRESGDAEAILAALRRAVPMEPPAARARVA